MPGSSGSSRRVALLLICVFAVICLFYMTPFQTRSARSTTIESKSRSHTPENTLVDAATLTGHVIMPKLGNETAKAELGRAAWKLLHTTMARFPDTPTSEESSALKTYLHLFQRLYPCGECAGHFGEILERFPPQVSSRSTAAAWACHVHNEVNKSLKKEIFDCSNIGDFYDCGCADDENEEEVGLNKAKQGKAGHTVIGRSSNDDYFTADALPMLKEEEYTMGG